MTVSLYSDGPVNDPDKNINVTQFGLYSDITPDFNPSEINVTQYGWGVDDIKGITLIQEYIDQAQAILKKVQEAEGGLHTIIEEAKEIKGFYEYIKTAQEDISLKYPQIQNYFTQITRIYNDAVTSASNASASAKSSADNLKAAQTILSQMQTINTSVQDTVKTVNDRYNEMVALRDETKTLNAESKKLVDDLRKGQVYRGTWSPHSAAWPAPQGTNSTWDVVLNTGEASFTWNNIKWLPGDRLLYILADNRYEQVESGVGVLSVNGKNGAVILAAADINAYTKPEVDTKLGTKLDKSGGTLTGALTGTSFVQTGAQGVSGTSLTRRDYVEVELAKKVDKATTINGKPLLGDITISLSDVGGITDDVFSKQGVISDFDGVTTSHPGYYTWTPATTPNKPDVFQTFGHMLTIGPGTNIGEGTWYTQVAFPHNTGDKIYFRTGINKAATTWNRIYSTVDKPTLEELGAKPASYVPAWAEITGKPSQATRWPTAAEVNAVAKAGDTMTGNLTIKNVAPQLIFKESDNSDKTYILVVDSGNIRLNENTTSITDDTVVWNWDSATKELRVPNKLINKGGITTSKVLVTDVQGTEGNSLARRDYVDTKMSNTDFAYGDSLRGTLAQDVNTWDNNLESGSYLQSVPGAARTVAVFHNDQGSARTIALSMAYTGETWVHSNVDGTKWITNKLFSEKNPPTATQVGALPLSGGTVAGDLIANTFRSVGPNALVSSGDASQGLYLNPTDDRTILAGGSTAGTGTVIIRPKGIGDVTSNTVFNNDGTITASTVGTAATHLITKGYVDTGLANQVTKTGDNMTGPLKITTDGRTLVVRNGTEAKFGAGLVSESGTTGLFTGASTESAPYWQKSGVTYKIYNENFKPSASDIGAAPATHSHVDATTSASGFMSAADKTKLNGLSNYVHPTGDGNLHVPSTGSVSAGKVLRAGATPGSISWENIRASDVGALPITGIALNDTALGVSNGTTKLALEIDSVNNRGYISKDFKYRMMEFRDDGVNVQQGVLMEQGVRVFGPNNLPTVAQIGAKPDSYVPSWGEVTGKPTTMAPSAHKHPWSDLTGLPAFATRWPTAAEVKARPDNWIPDVLSLRTKADANLPSAVGYSTFTNAATAKNFPKGTIGNGYEVVIGQADGKTMDSSIFQLWSPNDSTEVYVRTGDGSATGWVFRAWEMMYTSSNKPDAQGVGAVSKAGDTMTGKLTVPSFEDQLTGIGKTALEYKLFGAGDWAGSVGQANFVKPGSLGEPTGAKGGYWNVLGKRDSANGYAGIYIPYGNSENKIFIGKNESGTNNPSWAELYTTLNKPGWSDIEGKPTTFTPPRGAAINPIALSKEDLDSIINPGFYSQSANANASGGLHYPEALAGSLLVTSGAGVTQTYYVYNSSKVYIRSKYSSSAWTPWARQYNTENNPSATDVGALPLSGGTVTGNITGPDFLQTTPQTNAPGASTRKDYVDGLVELRVPKTTTVNGKSLSGNITLSAADVKALPDTLDANREQVINAPGGVVAGKYYPILFTNVGTKEDIYITTRSGGGDLPMNNCSFRGVVRSAGWSDKVSYVDGIFTIYGMTERAIHSIHGGTEGDGFFAVYVEGQAFPVTIIAKDDVTITTNATSVAAGTSVFTASADPATGNTKTKVLMDFNKGTGHYTPKIILDGGNILESEGGFLRSNTAQVMSLDGKTYSFVTAPQDAHLCYNSYWDGTNWLKYDNNRNSGYVVVNAEGLYYRTSGVGQTNPATNKYAIYHEGFKPTPAAIGAMQSTPPAISIASATPAMELHKPGTIAAMYHIDANNRWVFSQTGGNLVPSYTYSITDMTKGQNYFNAQRWTDNMAHGYANQWSQWSPLTVDFGTGAGSSDYYPVIKGRHVIGGQGYTTDVEFGMLRAGNNWGQAVIRVGSAEGGTAGTMATYNFDIGGNFTASGDVSGGTLKSGGGGVYTTGQLAINNNNPTLWLQDTDNRSAAIHNNSNLLYILRGQGNNAVSWDGGPNGRHPMTLSLETGDVVFSGNVVAYSDRRLKKEIKPLENALEKVMKLEGVNYKRIGNDIDRLECGFVAQDLQEVIPEVVLEQQDEDKTLTVDYAKMNAYLVEAIKEQQKMIKDLQDQIKEIKGGE